MVYPGEEVSMAITLVWIQKTLNIKEKVYKLDLKFLFLKRLF